MNMILKALALSLTTSLALSSAAQAVIVNIDAAVTGCQNGGNCDGSPHLPPGANPNFTASRFNGVDNWVWAFEVIDDATKAMLVQGCCGDFVCNTQAGAANQAFAQNYKHADPARHDHARLHHRGLVPP